MTLFDITTVHPDELARWRKAQAVSLAKWREAGNPSRKELDRLRLPRGCGARQHYNQVCIPMLDEHGELWALQFPQPDGESALYRFHSRLAGLRHHIGGGINGAVGVTIHVADACLFRNEESTPAVVAFEPENLAAVAASLRALHPSARVVIWAARERELDAVKVAAAQANVPWASPFEIGLIFTDPDHFPERLHAKPGSRGTDRDRGEP